MKCKYEMTKAGIGCRSKLFCYNIYCTFDINLVNKIVLVMSGVSRCFLIVTVAHGNQRLDTHRD